MPVLPAEGLYRGLVLEQGHHNVPVSHLLLLVDHHHVSGEDAGLQHGLAPDPQGKVLSHPAAGVKGAVVLDALLRQNGAAGGDGAQQGHLVAAVVGPVGDGDGPGLALRLLDEPRLPQSLQMKVHGGGGAQVHRLGDLPHGGGVAVLVREIQDKVINLLLFGG